MDEPPSGRVCPEALERPVPPDLHACEGAVHRLAGRRRTVAGRLGHSSGTTTLRVYAAWVDQADRRAAETMAEIMPVVVPKPRPPRGPYESIHALAAAMPEAWVVGNSGSSFRLAAA
jgi:hypothetical protein